MGKPAKLVRTGRKPLAKLEINVSEATLAVQDFARRRGASLVALRSDIRELASELVNQLLNLEMSVFLGDSEQKDNRRNPVCQ